MSASSPANTLILQADLGELPRLQAWLDAWIAAAQLPDSLLTTLNLCAEELIVNAINHGGDSGSAGPITLELAQQAGEVILSMADHGNAFDPTAAPDPKKATSVEDAPIGGWGIALVRQLSRAMIYQRRGNQNWLQLRFDAKTP